LSYEVCCTVVLFQFVMIAHDIDLRECNDILITMIIKLFIWTSSPY